ncbi:MAG: hypothetical protein A2189_05830 [Paenibacillus sp. RIFOXYA1_FULL_44_5]|nr:MAG: hypothetical protein A2189_05830 [Paenibacillus sp. RIFOXYA1_FULL_44_5]
MEVRPSLKTCTICALKKMYGITLGSGFICDTCEAEMVRTDVKDKKYLFFINRLRLIWAQKKVENAASGEKNYERPFPDN